MSELGSLAPSTPRLGSPGLRLQADQAPATPVRAQPLLALWWNATRTSDWRPRGRGLCEEGVPQWGVGVPVLVTFSQAGHLPPSTVCTRPRPRPSIPVCCCPAEPLMG